MSKTKILTGLIIGIFGSLALATPAYASVLAIQSLPGYINTNSFKLSCTSSGGVVQFSVSKHGGSYTNFGPAINTDSSPCVVQVDSSVVSDQTDYAFSVGGFTATTFYDISGPSPISGFYKERLNDGEYKLHWANPGDTDFDKVIIYRSGSQGFAADSSHEIARVSGGQNSAMTYDDHFTPDPGKTYYYLIRALDHAGNSSSLAGDGGTTTTVITNPTGATSGTGKVTQLPKEKGTGSVLGTVASPSPTPQGGVINQFNQLTSKTPQPLNWVLTHKKISLAVLVLVLGGYFIYRRGKGNN